MNRIVILSIVLVAVVSCDKLDTVGNYSVRSFGELVNSAPQLVTRYDINGGWYFSAPDGSARFTWSLDFAKSPLFDVMLEFDAVPFIAAGLEPSKLSDNFYFDSKSNWLVVGTRLGTEQLRGYSDESPITSYQQIVKLKRNAISYHGAMDHYGINLGDGNLFEWAKNLNTNDKDIVFVLNPEPFIKAGVDPNRIEGWLFTKVPVEDEKGRMIEVDKILKPFDLL
ncbi:MAG: hypothetical protein LBQ89_08535 [Treponema sp.]|jgi:hypothetical protein|nr:hypothetical protein [Treponema sp.]